MAHTLFTSQEDESGNTDPKEKKLNDDSRIPLIEYLGNILRSYIKFLVEAMTDHNLRIVNSTFPLMTANPKHGGLKLKAQIMKVLDASILLRQQMRAFKGSVSGDLPLTLPQMCKDASYEEEIMIYHRVGVQKSRDATRRSRTPTPRQKEAAMLAYAGDTRPPRPSNLVASAVGNWAISSESVWSIKTHSIANPVKVRTMWRRCAKPCMIYLLAAGGPASTNPAFHF